MQIGTVKEIWRHPVKSMAGEKLESCMVDNLGIPGDRGWALRDEAAGEITNGKRIPLLMQCSARYRQPPTNDTIPPVDITLSDGSLVASDDPQVNSRLSAALGKRVKLWPRQPANNKAHYRRNSPGSSLVGLITRIPGFRSLLPAVTRLPGLNEQLRKEFSRESGEPIPDLSNMPLEVFEFTSPLGTYFDAFPIHVVTTATLSAMAKHNPDALWDVRRFRPNFLIETTTGIEGLIEAGWEGKTLRIGTAELKCEIPTVRCGMTTHAQKELPKDPSVLRSIVRDADQNLGTYASVRKPGRVAIGDAVELL